MFTVAVATVLLAAVAHTAASSVLTPNCSPLPVATGGFGLQQYTATITPGSDWKVVVTPTLGDPDLFVNVDTTGFPTAGSADISSTGGAGLAIESVVILAPAAAKDTAIRIKVQHRDDNGGSLAYTIKVCAFDADSDADNDGVTDDKDLCPASTRGSCEHVDINGCEHDQVDFDMDGWCNPGMPRIGKKPFSTRADFCIGVDNCKFVKNAGHCGRSRTTPRTTATTATAPATRATRVSGVQSVSVSVCRSCVRACTHLRCIRLCDAAGCHEACLLGCDSIASQSPRDSIKSCTSPFRGGRYHNDLRCVPGYAYIEGSDFGCEKL
jgi:hypothetical protein